MCQDVLIFAIGRKRIPGDRGRANPPGAGVHGNLPEADFCETSGAGAEALGTRHNKD